MALVARSYIGLKQLCDPYMVGKKQYVDVELRSGEIRSVRAYTEEEYAKYYPDINPTIYKSQKVCLGFINDYIVIFKGDTYANRAWFKENGAQYNRWWGWAFPSEEAVPDDLPAGYTPIKLYWTEVGNEDETIKNDDIINAAVDKLIYDGDESEFQGSIGQRLELDVVVSDILNFDNNYGSSFCYLMDDERGNHFSWITSTSSKTRLEKDGKFKIRGTVKAFKTLKGKKSTQLSRCAIV